MAKEMLDQRIELVKERLKELLAAHQKQQMMMQGLQEENEVLRQEIQRLQATAVRKPKDLDDTALGSSIDHYIGIIDQCIAQLGSH